MSFAYELKKEIAQHRPNLVHHKAALAYGLIRFAKYYSADHVALHTEHRFVARLYSTVIADLIQLHYSITTQEKLAGESQYVYVVRVDSAGDRARLLEYFGAPQAGLNAEFFAGEGDFGAFIAGAYLACGAFSDPNKGYHLEFSLTDSALAEQLAQVLAERGLAPKLSRRRGKTVLYYKESEQIEELLALMGASRSTMELMEVKIVKELRNKVNRVTNCETANITKTVAASLAQVEDIRYIFSHGGAQQLPEDLLRVAQLRLANPEYSLRELGEALGGEVSRSSVNRRLAKLAKIARHMREERGEELDG